MNKVKYFFLLLAGLISLQVHAQRTFKGIVMDSNRDPLPGASVVIKGTSKGATTNELGRFTITLPNGNVTLEFSFIGCIRQEIAVNAKLDTLVVIMQPDQKELRDVIITAGGIKRNQQPLGYSVSTIPAGQPVPAGQLSGRVSGVDIPPGDGHFRARKIKVRSQGIKGNAAIANEEDYGAISENDFHSTKDKPLSTFSIDVDKAAYSNVRRFLNNGNLPPADAVRIEELINYFDYNYKSPAGNDPVAIYTDMASCPWEPAHQLVKIGLKAKEIPLENLPAANIVFLLDVSGSMSTENKLPLVKQALKVLVQQLRPSDKVAIVVYAGAAGVVLPSTSGSEKKKILDALEDLEAGGSTAGGEGIQLAYKTAADALIKNGNNRIILATDGDFNVGVSDNKELEKLIESQRNSGIYLSVLGFGMGNYKDSKLELLADKGNGNYAYIDNFEEARRIFVTEFSGTLFTIAKDVKLQLEFNPKYVQSYRLIGYENRLLHDRDFNDDKKDAGDMGVGHTVTALYEIIPAGNKSKKGKPEVDTLKYQQQVLSNGYTGEVLTVKLRYKQPRVDSSKLISELMSWKPQNIYQASDDFRITAAVATFGLLLRNSSHKGQANYKQALSLAEGAKGEDKEGYRAEFIQMIKKAMVLSNDNTSAADKSE
ncbi:VWA domain-containing protein [Chitinophaga sp. S165]|uniref:vWA domain-containing protein n=1 Tax=Chitinophaga sp. S165 TaxID=2135462 RepID=UPI000D882106|nr:VWA domain-containing protein [Chitinophaga sp. S165]PWV46494.1 Ca-activated chloride channel family protein [Chitinophaga sp. S165]